VFKVKSGLLVVASLLLAVAPLAPIAKVEASSPTIVDIAVSDGRFTTLVAAVTAAGLADALSAGEWTVFAPTDDAFAKLWLNAKNVADAFSKDELVGILLYHVLGAEIHSDKALTLLGDVYMYNGQRAGLKFFGGNLYVNDTSKVIIPDIKAANGVIHVVDTVILGPWPRVSAESVKAAAPAVAAGNSIVDIAVADGRFTTLVAAVTAAGLADALSAGVWTVFAPTDDAFSKLGLNAKNVADAFSKDELTDILLYHVLGAEIHSDKALTLLGDVSMYNGQRAGLKFFGGNLYVNDTAKVIIPDIKAANGVIHVVDTVILGPWPRAD
jgi:uncharacterized surface protein with fasciclin (FAS1) repeats